MSKLVPTSKSNPCAVCDGTDPRCRYSSDVDNKARLCMPGLSGAVYNPNYKFLHNDKSGCWGIYIPNESDGFNSEAYERNQERREQQKLDELDALKKLVPAKDRDRYYRRLAGYHGLSEAHREHLRARGLTDEQITEGLFFTFNTGDDAGVDLPFNFPGLGYNDKLYCANVPTAIACPAFDADGKVTGFQLRDTRADAKPKYKWAINCKLPNGEMPVTTFKAGGKAIYACEGFLKPYIAHKKLGIDVIGASGGGHTSSPQQTTKIIGQYKEVHLALDAGDYNRYQPLIKWLKLYLFCLEQGKSVKFAFWHQLNKGEQPDIDELMVEQFSQVEYLTLEEFLAHVPQEVKENSTIASALEDIKKAGKYDLILKNGLYRQHKIAYSKGCFANIDASNTLVEVDGVGEKAPIIFEAWRAGHRAIVDASFCGDGKSLTASQIGIDRANSKLDQLIYLCREPDNVTNKEITDRFVRLPKRDENNCHFTNEINSFREKLYFNVFCDRCPFEEECKSAGLQGRSGYKGQKYQILKQPYLLAHISGLPKFKLDELKTKGFIIDEPEQYLETAEVTAFDFDALYHALSYGKDLPDDAELQTGLVSILRECKPLYHYIRSLTKEVSKPKESYFCDLSNLIKPDIDFIYQLVPGQSNLSLPKAEKIEVIVDYIQECSTDALQGSTSLITNIFVPLIRMWLGGFEEAFIRVRRTHGKKHSDGTKQITEYIAVTYFNPQVVYLLRNAGFVLFLDATSNMMLLDKLMDKPVMMIRRSHQPLSNHKLNQYITTGFASRTSVSEVAIARKDKLINKLIKDCPNFAEVFFKKYGATYYWDNHETGTNQLMEFDHLVFTGLPNPNIDAIKTQWLLLTGSLDGWEKLQELEKFRKVVQSTGRARSLRHPDKEFVTSYINSGFPIELLEKMFGFSVEVIPSWNIIPELECDKQGHGTKWKLLNAAVFLDAIGDSISRASLAQFLNTSENTIKDVASLDRITGFVAELKMYGNPIYSLKVSRTSLEEYKNARNTLLAYVTVIGSNKKMRQFATPKLVLTVSKLIELDKFSVRNLAAELGLTKDTLHRLVSPLGGLEPLADAIALIANPPLPEIDPALLPQEVLDWLGFKQPATLPAHLLEQAPKLYSDFTDVEARAEPEWEATIKEQISQILKSKLGAGTLDFYPELNALLSEAEVWNKRPSTELAPQNAKAIADKFILDDLNKRIEQLKLKLTEEQCQEAKDLEILSSRQSPLTEAEKAQDALFRLEIIWERGQLFEDTLAHLVKYQRSCISPDAVALPIEFQADFKEAVTESLKSTNFEDLRDDLSDYIFEESLLEEMLISLCEKELNNLFTELLSLECPEVIMGEDLP